MKQEPVYPSFSKIRVWRCVHKIISELEKHESCEYSAPLCNGWSIVGIKHSVTVKLMNVSIEYEFCLYNPDECVQKSIGFGKLTRTNIRDTVKFMSSGKE